MVIPEGRGVFFFWRNLIALSGGARGRNIWSFKLVLVATGRLRVPMVSGPATLILHAHGETHLAADSMDARRLIAWADGTEFRVGANRWMYLTPTDIAVQSGNLSVRDSSEPIKGKAGLCRLLWMAFPFDPA